MKYNYLAKVERVGPRWRGSIPGMPVEVLCDRLDQMSSRLESALIVYLGVGHDLVSVDFDVPGANRPPKRASRGMKLRRLSTVAQILGGAITLAGVWTLLGAGAALLGLGLALAAVGTLTELQALPRKAEPPRPRSASAVN